LPPCQPLFFHFTIDAILATLPLMPLAPPHAACHYFRCDELIFQRYFDFDDATPPCRYAAMPSSLMPCH
jgi:hypothetical protein